MNYLSDPLIWPYLPWYFAGYAGVWVVLFGFTRLMADGTQPGSYERAAVVAAMLGVGGHLVAGVGLIAYVAFQASARLSSTLALPQYLAPYVFFVLLDLFLIFGALRTRTG